MTTETFDIPGFNKHKNKSGSRNFKLDDGTMIYQSTDGDNFKETRASQVNDHFEIQKTYSKTGNLIQIIEYYPKDFMVLKKEYNKVGKLVKETNFDESYAFNFNMLVNMIKEDYPKINLNHRATTITRGISKKSPIWEVRSLNGQGRIEKIVLNGTTGEILDKSEHIYIDN